MQGEQQMRVDPRRREFLSSAITTGLCVVPAIGFADPPEKKLREPVLRVSKAKLGTRKNQVPSHPLDPALEMAASRLAYFREHVRDYTCVMVKREQTDGKPAEREYMFAKVRSRRVENGRVVVPFSVYLYSLRPKEAAGREVIYVEGKNAGKLVAHEAPNTLVYKTVGSVWLDPDGPIAMRGQRYGITHAGMENLLIKLLERGNRDRKRGPCEVKNTVAKINKRECDVIQIRHPERDKNHDFYLARIFMDRETQLPIRYASYQWPTSSRSKLGPIIEEYTYLDLKLNVGLTDADFNHRNPKYLFVRKAARKIAKKKAASEANKKR